MGAMVIELMAPPVAVVLLLLEIEGRKALNLLRDVSVHPLMTAVVLG